jgi:RimJ/RimL family protein N-acetyltransferase
MTVLTTARLRLVPFQDDHLDGLHELNADPDVMRFLSGPETREQTMAVIERVKARWSELGYSWWSFIEHDSGELVGSGAIQNLRRVSAPEPDLTCPLEIGWRLKRSRWGHGLASEAAQAMAGFAFDTLRADELYAVCHPDNLASAKVMARLGMQHAGLQGWYGKPLTTYQLSAAGWRDASSRRPFSDGQR